MSKKIVFSGVQPTGSLHIGNLIGAISLWVELQSRYDSIFCVVDLHALTIPEAIDPAVLQEKCLEVAALYLACGIDPEESTIFIQSQVTQHSELAWVLNCVTPFGWMTRMTQFKSKGEKAETVGVGLFGYPVLQAADILLYQSDFVPVGEDQRQHIEIAQDIAQRFTHLFGYEFNRPEVLSQTHGSRVMGLDDPTAKMSKSSLSQSHAVNLTDDDKAIRKKFQSAVTDSGTSVDPENLSPGVRNLITIYNAFSDSTFEESLGEFAGSGYGHLKKSTADAVVEGLGPIKRKYAEIRDDDGELLKILRRSGDAAAERAEATMKKVRESVGLFSAYKS